jgi:L-ascorbate metabolism protein UlaG (beta-lactamase superfamily)
MVKDVNGQPLMLGPRDKGLAFTTPMKNLHTLSVNETIQVDGITITGLKATHGPLTIKIGPFSKTLDPGPEERIGWGAMGFQIQFDGLTMVNLGDTLPHFDDWKSIKYPDVLMTPIGGKAIHNTMDEDEALQAVDVMRSKLVIPCHYNCPAFFTKKYNPADDQQFKEKVESLGIKCVILNQAEFLEL